MNGWTLTKVWQVDHKLVVADSISDAVELFKAYMGNGYTDEPYSVQAISLHTANYQRDALGLGQSVESPTEKDWD